MICFSTKIKGSESGLNHSPAMDVANMAATMPNSDRSERKGIRMSPDVTRPQANSGPTLIFKYFVRDERKPKTQIAMLVCHLRNDEHKRPPSFGSPYSKTLL